MKPISAGSICTATQGTITGNSRATVTGVATDTRQLSPGDAFFALVARRDGHEFVADAFRAGASVAVVSTPVDLPPGKTAVVVGDTLEALGKFAAWYRRRMPATVIGITGSNGKTTTKEMLACLLAAAAPTVKSPESFNNAIGVPRTLFRLEPDDRYAVVEMGTSSPGEIAHLALIARPRIGVITNVAPTHLEGLGNIKGVAIEKGRLIEAVPPGGTAVVNADNHWCREIAGRSPARVITFGIEEDADVRATDIRTAAAHTRFEAAGRQFVLPAIGRHNVYNALAAITVALELGLDLDLIQDRLSSFKLPPMRMQRIEIGDVTVFNDAYNANFESMLAALREYARLPVPGRRVVVCGDMLELGDQSQAIHWEVGKRVAAADFDLLVAVGNEAQTLAMGAAANGMPHEQVLLSPNTEKAGQLLPRVVGETDTVLLKASRGMKFESLVEAIQRWEPAGTPVRTDVAEAYHAFRATVKQESGNVTAS